MTIVVTWSSKTYTESIVIRRYVKKYGDVYAWCEQNITNGYDVRQGIATDNDLPRDIKQKCDDYNGAFYVCEWPL